MHPCTKFIRTSPSVCGRRYGGIGDTVWMTIYGFIYARDYATGAVIFQSKEHGTSRHLYF